MSFDITLFAANASYTIQKPVFKRDENSGFGPATVVTIRASLQNDIGNRMGDEAGSDALAQMGASRSSALAQAVARVENQFRTKTLHASDVARAIRLGRKEEALAMVANLSNVPPSTVVRAIMYGDIVYAMRRMIALGIDEVTAGMILRSFSRILDGNPTASKGAEAYMTAHSTYANGFRAQVRCDLTA